MTTSSYELSSHSSLLGEENFLFCKKKRSSFYKSLQRSSPILVQTLTSYPHGLHRPIEAGYSTVGMVVWVILSNRCVEYPTIKSVNGFIFQNTVARSEEAV
jgi:hypothetical protein